MKSSAGSRAPLRRAKCLVAVLSVAVFASCEPSALSSRLLPSGGLTVSIDPLSHHLRVKFYACDDGFRVTSLQVFDIASTDNSRAGSLVATFTPSRDHEGAPWEFILGRDGFSGGTTTIFKPAVFASLETLSIDRAVVVTAEGPIDASEPPILSAADVTVDVAELRQLPTGSVVLVDRR